MTDVHIMIDLETFATSSAAGVVQVGACAFTFEPVETGDLSLGPGHIQGTFEATVTLQSSLLSGGEIDPGTVDFWRKQPKGARDSICGYDAPGGAVPISVALAGLSAFYDAHQPVRTWAHGATFDPPILDGYYRRLGLPTPWPYSSVRDTRTLFEIAATLAGWMRPSTPVAHTAMADAVAQARDAVSAWRALASLGRTRDG
jgi:hypothetical protein